MERKPDSPRCFPRRGRLYRVGRAFTDVDGANHPVGESWTFQERRDDRRENTLLLLVTDANGADRWIRLRWNGCAGQPCAGGLQPFILPVQQDGAAWRMMLTRDSVCMGDDCDAPHEGEIDVARDCDAAGVAAAILDSSYLADVGHHATWSLTLDADRVLFGRRHDAPFVQWIDRRPLTATAAGTERLHCSYWQQEAPDQLRLRLLAGDTRTSTVIEAKANSARSG